MYTVLIYDDNQIGIDQEINTYLSSQKDVVLLSINYNSDLTKAILLFAKKSDIVQPSMMVRR